MAIDEDKQKKLHYDLSNVGLRAQATAVGLLQLCIELRRENVISPEAIDRIKGAISEEIIVTAPRSICSEAYRRDVRSRLDRLFAGGQVVGPADALSFGGARP